MSENVFWFWVQKLNGWARVLVFPAFLIGSVSMLLSAMTKPGVKNYEMPVIMVYCNERDLAAEGGRDKALANKDMPLVRCQEKVVWQGNKREAIDGLAYAKGEAIVNSLFSNPKNPAMVREAVTKNLEYFETGSDAETLYRHKADDAVRRSANISSSFKITESYVRVIERDDPDDNRWVVKFAGIWVKDDGSQKGEDVLVMLSFKPTRHGERREKQQALIVTKMEVSDEG